MKTLNKNRRYSKIISSLSVESGKDMGILAKHTILNNKDNPWFSLSNFPLNNQVFLYQTFLLSTKHIISSPNLSMKVTDKLNILNIVNL